MGISCQVPSRSTVAVGATEARKRSAVRWDRKDCQKLTLMPMSTIVTMSVASVRWPSDAEMALAARRMPTSGFANRRTICINTDKR